MKTARTCGVAVVLLIGAGDVRGTYRAAQADEPQTETVDGEGSSAATSGKDEAVVAVENGRRELQKAKSAEDPVEKGKHLRKAREFFEEGRRRFRASHDSLKAAYEKFDKFIPKEDAPRYEARERAYGLYVQAQLNLAMTTYEEAQTWERGALERKNLLTDAANAFEQIHARYRLQLAGLYARLYQGKCFEDQDDLVKAMGIYNELLGHGGDKPTAALKQLQDRVRLFRLICLNRDERKDYALVVREAEEWLAENEQSSATRVGLGIQWELARALEHLALRDESSAAERRQLLKQAFVTARAVREFSSEFKAPADLMIKRLRSALDID
jgi:hypothetical protein